MFVSLYTQFLSALSFSASLFAITKKLYSMHSEPWEMTYAYFIFNSPLICLAIKCVVNKFNDAINNACIHNNEYSP